MPLDNIDKAKDFRKQLGGGESEVISLGIEKKIMSLSWMI
jgi:predicted nucleic acid-binding protein